MALGTISFGGQSQVSGYALAVSIYDTLDPNFLDVKYPKRLWEKVFKGQTVTNINAGAQNWVRMSKDKRGQAAFQGNIPGANIPRVGLSIGALTTPLAASAIGADITNEDARQYKAGNLGTLPQDLQEAMQIGLSNLVEVTTFFGDVNVGFNPFLSYTGITVVSAALNGGGTSRLWSAKTGLEIWQDINSALTTFWTNSNTIMVADAVYVPPAQYALLQQPLTVGGVVVSSSVLKYLKENNIAVAEGVDEMSGSQDGKDGKGGELKILPIRYLKGAGVGGLDRMIVMKHDKDYQAIPIPLPPQMQAPVPKELGSTLIAEQKHGSLAIFQQASVLYVDGI
jgi:hypothetical protein